MRTVAALFLLVVLTGPCLAQAKSSSDDDRIYDQVRLRLAEDRDVKGGALEVEVAQGVVTLRGKVRSQKIKEKAERITRRVKGVKKVINKLETRVETRDSTLNHNFRTPQNRDSTLNHNFRTPCHALEIVV